MAIKFLNDIKPSQFDPIYCHVVMKCLGFLYQYQNPPLKQDVCYYVETAFGNTAARSIKCSMEEFYPIWESIRSSLSDINDKQSRMKNFVIKAKTHLAKHIICS